MIQMANPGSVPMRKFFDWNWWHIASRVLALSAMLGPGGHGVLADSAAGPAVVGTGHNDHQMNFLVIVVDDLGYSDIGAFGGADIETPVLDHLANDGVKLASFYTAPTCSPTRAALLTGTDPHIAGLGNMAELLVENQRNKPGYEGYLNERVVTVATLLRDAGYFTAMTGKWHLGLERNQGPAAHGFTRSFVLLDGGAAHFDDTGLMAATPVAQYREGLDPANWPRGGYSSDVYTDRMIQYLRENGGSKPFFAYLAFTAPHWPLQAPDELIRKYHGRYDEGWDVLRDQRLAGLRRAGLASQSARSTPPPGYRPWNALKESERRIEAKKMEIYAAMVDDVDRNIGRLLEELSRTGELRNTMILVMSDNGAEGTPLERSPLFSDWIKRFDNSLENMGRAGSYVFYGPNWAYAATAPGKYYKSHTSEGGIHTPALMWRADLASRGTTARAIVTVMDIAPTLLELAGVTHPSFYQGRAVAPLRGRSLAAFFENATAHIHSADTAFGTELFGRRALREGDWKILLEPPPFGSNQWQLYDLTQDPGETQNLAEKHPNLVERLAGRWSRWAKEVGVVLPEGQSGY